MQHCDATADSHAPRIYARVRRCMDRRITRRQRTAHIALTPHHTTPSLAVLTFVTLCLVAVLSSCSNGTSSPTSTDSSTSETSGPAFERPELALSPFDETAAVASNGTFIDISHTSAGYVAAAGTSSQRLKLQVAHGDMSYYYDLPADGSAISCPLNMGDGIYEITIWENTSGNRYVALSDTLTCDVSLSDEFQPFLRPNVFCSYDADSECTRLANELTADAENEGDALRSIYAWITENIAYDREKAESVADATSYVPNPDTTLAEGKGICFDYASLAAAMLRSQGIPCRIVTGNVSPDNIYHAWNLVYIDGSWVTASISVDPNTWTRIDLTFAAGGGSAFVGDGTSYTDRYTY